MFEKLITRSNLRCAVIGILLTAFLVMSVHFFKQKKVEDLASRPKPLPAVAYYPVPKTFGPDSAPVKIIEYSDFECPSCRVVQDIIKALSVSYPGKIQVTFHHYPLSGHRWSIYAHQAAECMHIQGKFWQYHDILYTRQKDWVPSPEPPVQKLMEYAKECGASMDTFSSCMVDPKVSEGIHAEKNEGSLRQVSATPTLFLGDKRYVGPRELEERGQNDIRRILGLPELPPLPPLPSEASRTARLSAPQPEQPTQPAEARGGSR